MFYIYIYILSALFHGVALFYGLRTLYVGQELFMNSNPLHFFKSHIEQTFWTVCVGSLSNFCFLLVLVLYAFRYHGDATGELEPIFLTAHVTGAFSTIIWHKIALARIIKEKGSYEAVTS